MESKMPSTDKSKSSPNKKRLGRGLGSLLSTDMGDFDDNHEVKSLESNKTEEEVQARPKEELKKTAQPKVEPVKISTVEPEMRIWKLAIEKVVPNETQPRKDFDKEPLQELADSIKEQGVLQPITVRKIGDKYQIIAGERRWRASQLAGKKEIPAILRNVDDRRSMELALIENLQRENLNPVEEALGYQLLIDDHSLSQKEVASKLGKSRSAVTNSLRILVLPRDVRQMLRQGILSVGHAKVLLGLENPKQQTKMARKAVQKKLSVRALERELGKLKASKSSDISDLAVEDRLVSNMAQDLQKLFGTKVKIKYLNGKGQIQINFYSDDELSGFVETAKNSWKS